MTINEKYFCEQCQKEVEVSEEKKDENGHLFKLLSCGHETPRDVRISDSGVGEDTVETKNILKINDSGTGKDKIKINRLWDSLSITFVGILISVGLTIGFGIGTLTKNLYFGIIGFIIGLVLTALILKTFRNFLIKIVSWIWR